MRFFIGGYSSDLNAAWLDPANGSIDIVSSVTTPQNASFVRHVPALSALYATVETGSRAGAAGQIAAYRVGEDGELTAIGSVSSCGASPCHLAVDPGRQILTAANYGGENFVVIALEPDGALGEQVACIRHSGSSVNPNRQAEPHPHATTFSPDARALFVCDLGTDTITSYSIDDLLAGRTEGRTVTDVTPGAGPRHLEFSADAKFAYLVTELANTVIAYAYDEATGTLTKLQEISTLPPGFDGTSTAAEIQLHPSGAFLYASNRGHDSIAVFTRDAATGLLETDSHFDTTGSGPRHFQIDPSGEWCLVSNQASDHVVSFRIDPTTGRGTWTGKSITVPQPSCAEFLRS